MLNNHHPDPTLFVQIVMKNTTGTFDKAVSLKN
jgi:hypothetical protein